jgi:hypothetical protein
MDVGAVSFYNDKMVYHPPPPDRQVRKVLVERRRNEIVNRLDKTREERHPDLKGFDLSP